MNKNVVCNECVFENTQFFCSSLQEMSNQPFSDVKIKNFEKGEMIIKQEDKFNGVYCIKKGIVKIVKKHEKANSFLLWVAEPGELIGIDALINNDFHSSSAIAVDDCELCFITEEAFRSLLEKHPVASLELIKILCSKIDYIESRMTSIACKKSRTRLAEQLLQMSLKNNEPGTNSSEFKIDVNELANMIGTTRHYVIKLIGQLTKTGMIKARLDKMKILDFDKLFKEASGDFKHAG